MSKEEVISAIRHRNPSAAGAFLDRFETPLLAEYLRRLRALQDHAAADARWVRTSRQPACVGMAR